jgi:hypothetical protein
MELLKFILSSAALTWIFTRSGILKSTREYITTKAELFKFEKTEFGIKKIHRIIPYLFFTFLNEILSCYACTGFWCGIIIHFVMKYDLQIIQNCLIGLISSLTIISYNQYLNRR